MRIRAISIFIALSLTSVAAAAEVAWRHRLGNEQQFHRPTALAWSAADRTFVVAGTSVPAGAKGAEARNALTFWVWRVDESGAVVQQTLIDPPGGRRGAVRRRAIADIVALPDGGAALVVEFESNAPYFVRIDKQGEVLAGRTLSDGKSETTFFRMLPTRDRGFLLLGRSGVDALVVKVDDTGTIAWRKTHDRGAFERFTDAIEAGSKFIVAGDSGEYKPEHVASVWVATLSESGDIERETMFTGRQPAIARASNGTIAVSYDASIRGVHYRIRAFDAELAPAWEADVAPPSNDLSFPSRISADGSGFLIASQRGARLALWRVAGDGKVVDRYLEPVAGSKSWSAAAEDVIAMNGAHVVLTTMVSELPSRVPNFQVGLVKTN